MLNPATDTAPLLDPKTASHTFLQFQFGPRSVLFAKLVVLESSFYRTMCDRGCPRYVNEVQKYRGRECTPLNSILGVNNNIRKLLLPRGETVRPRVPWL
jgi:hypothetical protein